MREYLDGILGTYTPTSYEGVILVDGEEMFVNIIPDGMAGLDWSFVISGLVLVIGIWSIFKIFGLIIKGLLP